MPFSNKIFLAALCFLFYSIAIQSQNTTIDSLKIELQNHIAKDTTRVNLLNALAFSYFSNDMPKALEYLEESDAITEVIQFKKGKARSIYIRGITEVIQANFEQAFGYYNEALKLYENIGFKRGIANCNNALGIAYKNKGELRKSILYLKKAIKIEEEIGGKNLSAALINLGAVYQDLGEFDEALSYLKKAFSIAKVAKNDQRIAYSLNNLGTVYEEQGNYPLALKHYKESMYINEKLGDSLGIVNNLVNMGTIYNKQEDYEKAMEYYERCLEINKRINRKRGISSLLSDIGTIHEENGDYNNALDHYVDALRISKQIGAKSDIPNILNNIGAVYLALNDYKAANKYFVDAKKIGLAIESKPVLCETYIGLAKTYANQNEYTNALSNALEAKKISKKAGYLNYEKEASGILSKIYKATGNYKNALESHQQFKILNDSLFNKENVEKIARLEYEYKYKQALDSASIRELKLTKEVSTINTSLEKSQREIFLTIIALLLTALILGGVIFFLKWRNIKEKNQNVLIEQKLLRSQMTPHFIFNSLSVLQGMILNKEDKKSITYLSKFSKLLRIVLENSREKIVPLIQELDAVDNYMVLQNLDTNQPYDYSLLVDENIDINALQIPPMLIQPFIENSIAHAFPFEKAQREIVIHLKFVDEKLTCTIADNGIGIDAISKKIKTSKKSLATTITNERILLLAKEFKVPGEITIEDRKKYNVKGTLVTLVIPYKINEN
ncbi:tetratricopeptide repeat protein [Aurantibacter sp.]|uniref:tetratricopeptide repeat-containing sensor histidine kinase n=1 Tax=Aurantibacter sp. TaxID=2807103 RepID=UPI003262D349